MKTITTSIHHAVAVSLVSICALTACDAEQTTTAQTSMPSDQIDTAVDANSTTQPIANTTTTDTFTAEDVAAALKQRVTNDTSKWKPSTLAAYTERDFKPIWFREDQSWFAEGDEYKATRTAKKFAQVLKQAEDHGFPEDYFADINLPEKSASYTADQIAQKDLELSQEFLAFAQDMQYGRVDPKQLARDWRIPRPSFAAKDTLHKVAGGDIAEVLGELTPKHPFYQALLQERKRLQTVVATTTAAWPLVPASKLVKPGEQHDVVVALKQRLIASYDLPADHLQAVPEMPAALAAEPADRLTPEQLTQRQTQITQWEEKIATAKRVRQTLDEPTVAALQQFQTRNNLAADGILGGRTRAALNQSPTDLIAKIDMNLERLRWLPRQLGGDGTTVDARYVFVNIAAFKLDVMNGGTSELSMPVIVGETQNKTPIFSDKMEYVEINPYWNVPASITNQELLPKVIRDPSYLEQNNFEVVDGYGDRAPVIPADNIDWNEYADGGWFPYRLRQKSGDQNALGRIKFMFPNEFNVYLHDTPTNHLFGNPQRTYSHGCVRVAEPVKFGSAIIGWNESRVQQAIDSRRRQQVTLDKKIPVYLVYLTAWPENGEVRFTPDVYAHDQKLITLLKNKARKFASL